jgi:hypothetical protein
MGYIETAKSQSAEVPREVALSDRSISHFQEVLGLLDKAGHPPRFCLGIANMSGTDGSIFKSLG